MIRKMLLASVVVLGGLWAASPAEADHGRYRSGSSRHVYRHHGHHSGFRGGPGWHGPGRVHIQPYPYGVMRPYGAMPPYGMFGPPVVVVPRYPQVIVPGPGYYARPGFSGGVYFNF